MELSTSSALGAARLSVQVISAQKRPILEIYEDVRNDFGPPYKIPYRGADERIVHETEHRDQKFSVHLVLANIGAERAENVRFETSGDFQREPPMDHFPEKFSEGIHQMPPGQIDYLWRIDEWDLFEVIPETNSEGVVTSRRRGDFKASQLTIEVFYDGPDTPLRRLARVWTKWIRRRKSDYSCRYTFNPSRFGGDLPPPRYAA